MKELSEAVWLRDAPFFYTIHPNAKSGVLINVCMGLKEVRLIEFVAIGKRQ